MVLNVPHRNICAFLRKKSEWIFKRQILCYPSFKFEDEETQIETMIKTKQWISEQDTEDSDIDIL